MTTPNPAAQLPIVASALHASLAVYVVVAFVATPAEASVEPGVLVPVLGAAAVGTLAIAALLPRLWPVADDATHATRTIAAMAIAESAAILGLLAAFLTAAPWTVLPFAVAAAATQVAVGPFGPLGRR